MARLSRRAFLKRVSLLAAMGSAACSTLLWPPSGLAQPLTGDPSRNPPSPAQPQPANPRRPLRDDLLQGHAPAPRQVQAPATLTSYQMQTPRQAVLMDVSGDLSDTRFGQLRSQGYYPLTLQGADTGGSGPAYYSGISLRALCARLGRIAAT